MVSFDAGDTPRPERRPRRTVEDVSEQQPYDVIETHDEFELRRYPEHLVAEISVTAPFEEAGSRAFRALAGYINGQNRSRSTVAMTAPVVQRAGSVRVAMTAPVLQSEGESDDYVIAFVLPSGMTAATVPVPTDPDVRTRVVPVQVAAARRFSGRGSEDAFARHLRDLESALASAGLSAVGSPRFARFDAPYVPGLLRRNEVVIEIEA